MSYLLGGLLQGVGGAIEDRANSKREHAQRLLQIEAQAEATASARAKHRAPARGLAPRGGGGGRKSTDRRGLSNTESDNLARLYKNYVDGGSFDGEAPSLGQFENRVEQIISEDRGSLSSAAERARAEWGHQEVTSEEQVPRNFVGRLIHGEDTRTVERTDLVGGFGSALGEQPRRSAVASAPQQSSNQALEQARQAISAGADRKAVADRLREMGIDPEGL